MKRRWRLGRIVLAVVLLAIAALTYWIWPGVSWKIEGEKAIGFDVAKGLVYTVKNDDGKHELRGYDVWSGEKSLTLRLAVENGLADSHWLLLPHKRGLIGVSHKQGVQHFDFETGRPLGKYSIRKGGDLFDLAELHSGVSRDGNEFALMDPFFATILIWNVDKAESVAAIPSSVQDYSRFMGNFYLDRDRLCFDRTGRFLAYFKRDKLILFDIAEKKTVFEQTVSRSSHRRLDSTPRFIDDGQTVVFTPTIIDRDYKPTWYRRTSDGKWQLLSVALANENTECNFVRYTDQMIVTDCPTRSETKRPEWLPEMMWVWAKKLFALNGTRHHLQFWDVHTGQLSREYRFYEPTNRHGYFSEDLQTRTFISEDGQWLAVDYEEEVTVYNLTGRRIVWCWAVVVGLMVFAGWCAWPRKVKLA